MQDTRHFEFKNRFHLFLKIVTNDDGVDGRKQKQKILFRERLGGATTQLIRIDFYWLKITYFTDVSDVSYFSIGRVLTYISDVSRAVSPCPTSKLTVEI